MPATERAHWDPSYWDGALGDAFGNEPKWACELARVLLGRTDEDSYWALVDLVTRHAPNADHLVVVEQSSPYAHRSHAFALLAVEGNRFWCYTSDPAPALDSTTRVPSAWGECGVRSANDARVLLEQMERHGVWSAPLRAYILEDPGTGPRFTWFVHAYRRDGDRYASFIVEGPHDPIDARVVQGTVPLTDLRLTRPNPPPAHDLFGRPPPASEIEAARRYEQAFADSFPARLLLSGVFRIASTGKGGKGEVGNGEGD